MTNTVLDIEQLAKQEVGLPEHPFFKRSYGGQTAYRNMQTREALLAAVLEIYHGEGAKYIDPYPSETEAQARNKVGRWQHHLLMSFINKWNTLYTEDPVRVFEYDGKRLQEDDERNTVLQEQYRKGHVNDIMEQADSLLRLTGVVALRPWFDADEEETVVHLYSANNIRPIQNRNNPKRPHAVALVGKYQLEDPDGGATFQHNSEFFTAEKWGRIDAGKIKVEKLQYSEIPVAYGWEKYPTNKTGFFVPCPGPALAAIDRLLANDFTSHLGFVTIMQGFGIPVTWGLASGQTIKIGPDATVEFDGDLDAKEDFEFKNPNAPITEISDMIEKLIKWTREDFDIPASILDVSMAPSGVAQVEANAPLGMLRLKRSKQMRPLENMYLRKKVVVLQEAGVLSSSLDPSKFGLSIFYPEPQITQSTDKQMAEDRFGLEIGTKTRAQIYMRDNPESFDSEEECETWLRERALKLATDVTKEGGDLETGSPASSEEPPSPVDGSTPPADTGDTPADEAMNGAQVSALQGLVEGVAGGTIPAKSALLMAKLAFPSANVAELQEMFNVAEAFEPKKDDPPAVPNTVLDTQVTPPVIDDGEDDSEKETSNDGNEW